MLLYGNEMQQPWETFYAPGGDTLCACLGTLYA
jgi:hypothetical protein